MPPKKKRLIRGAKNPPPRQAEIKLRNELLSMVAEINSFFRNEIAPVIKRDKTPIADHIQDGVVEDETTIEDGVVSDITERIAALQLVFNFSEPDRAKAGADFVKTIDRINKGRFDNSLKFAGFEVSQLSEIAASEGITEAITASTAENVALITRMGQDYIDKIQQAVLDNYLSGKFEGKGGLNAELRRIAGISRNRAKLIARDQTSKVTGVMNRLRMEASGSIGYQWRNVGDERVRGNPNGKYPNSKYNHWNRDKKYYLWRPMNNPPLAPDGKPFRQPPPDGDPGIPINCRCFAIAVWQD